ncbi:MAG: porin family protein [Chitinophagaceae bacterium]
MKKVFIAFVCATSLLSAKAQVKFGVKAGANISNWTGDVEDTKSKVGLNVGAYAKIPLFASFSLNPEVYFSGQGVKGEESGVDVKYNTNYINIPVLFQYNHASGFFAHTGPQIGILLSAKEKAEDVSVDVKEYLKKADFAWAFGAGYITKLGLGINVRYNLGLANVLDESGETSVKNSVFQVGLLYQFGGK